MFIIGLTGGISSGKSTAAKILKELGLKIIDLDQITHDIMKIGELGYIEIKKEFGEKYIDTKNAIDRKLLRDEIFSSLDLKKRIESILHPIIFETCNEQLNKLKHEKYLVLVIPLLFETKNYISLIDESLLIDCDLKTQIERVINRDGVSEQLASRIIKNQMSRDEKVLLADKVILNDGNINYLKAQLESYYKNLLKDKK
ncbi:dephospho-CoA kinase [Methylophilaceae bacterium]|jgi:dephospho-CoA kinase|nr:dephospho-CoA kinase [Methylophilaceae bacterium]|tara:strand:- start:1034 stop:1633 length:600 start_codon:yes stop_codon:yes gene_type:complete